MSTIKSSSDHLTLNADGASKDIKFQANGVEKASISSAGAFTSTTIDATKLTGNLPAISGASLTGVGKVKQIVNYQTGALATGTTTIPIDDTIPQITEGDEYMTLAITPRSATNRLLIEVGNSVASSASAELITALFVGTTTDALAAVTTRVPHTNTSIQWGLIHNMIAGVTTELTFRIRIGSAGAGTTSFNGRSAVRRFGGVMASSITITEYEV